MCRLSLGSPYSLLPPIDPATYNSVSKEELLHLVLIPNRTDLKTLEYEVLLWELNKDAHPNISLYSNRSCRYYSISYSTFGPFLKWLGVSFPEQTDDVVEKAQRDESNQAQVVVMDRKKETWIRLPLVVLEHVSLFESVYSILESIRVSGDVTWQVVDALSQVPRQFLSTIWKNRNNHHQNSTIPKQVSSSHSSLYMLHGPEHLQQLWKANNKPVQIILFHVPWCIFCQQALPAYSYIANLVDHNLLRIYQYDCQQYPIPREWDDWIDGFPTVLIFSSKYFQSPLSYEGPHTVDAILQYLQTRCLNKTLPLF